MRVRLVFFIMALAWLLCRPEPCFSQQGFRYVDVAPFAGGFAVLDSAGVVRLCSEDGVSGDTLAFSPGGGKALSLASVQDALVAAGDSALVCLLDGRYTDMRYPGGRIAGICGFRGAVAAVSTDGTVYFWDSPFSVPKRVPFVAKGLPVGISGGSELCCALTDSSELVIVDASLHAEVFGFNENYSAYYGSVELTCAAAGAGSLCAAGTDASGEPVAYVSSKGKVWSERPLEYTLGGRPHVLRALPVAAAYNAYSDEFVLVCDDGTLFHLPACSHCNYPEFPSSGRLARIAFNGERYLAVGDSLY